MNSYTKTTTHLRLAARRLDHPLIILAIVFGVVLVASLIAALGRHSAPVTAAAVPTPQLPIIMIATAPAPTPAAQAASTGANVLPRAVVAYTAPDGSVIGAVEAGRHYGFLARSGDAWLQLAIDGSGDVWVRSADLIGAPDLADVATPTTEPRIAVVSAPAWPQRPVDQPQELLDQAAPPAPAPQPAPSDVPMVPITPANPPAGEFDGPGSSSGGSW